MKQCPQCGADIASDRPDCGRHNTVTVPRFQDPLMQSAAIAQANLDNARIDQLTMQTLVDSLKNQLDQAELELEKRTAMVEQCSKALAQLAK